MAFCTPDHNVSDTWVADVRTQSHMLFQPVRISVASPDLRHYNTQLGRAASLDLETRSLAVSWRGPGADVRHPDVIEATEVENMRFLFFRCGSTELTGGAAFCGDQNPLPLTGPGPSQRSCRRTAHDR